MMDAAKALFARQGIDNTRINEITEEADVGFGSFYNHFDSKEAIVEAVLEEAIAAQGSAIEAVTADLDDRRRPSRWLTATSSSSPARTQNGRGCHPARDPSQPRLRSAKPVRPARSRPRHQGGTIQVPHKQVALFAAGGALLAVMRAVLDGQAPRNADRHHAEGVLRLFGLEPEDAAEVARRPMPKIPPGPR